MLAGGGAQTWFLEVAKAVPGKEHVWRELGSWGGIWGQTCWVQIPAWGSRPCFLHLHKGEMLSIGMKRQDWRKHPARKVVGSLS